jgi:hypothetical protein
MSAFFCTESLQVAVTSSRVSRQIFNECTVSELIQHQNTSRPKSVRICLCAVVKINESKAFRREFMYPNNIRILLHCFPYFEKINVGLCDHHVVCVPVYTPYQRLHACLCETWYLYRGTWAHLNGVLRKSLPSDFVSVRVSAYYC